MWVSCNIVGIVIGYEIVVSQRSEYEHVGDNQRGANPQGSAPECRRSVEEWRDWRRNLSRARVQLPCGVVFCFDPGSVCSPTPAPCPRHPHLLWQKSRLDCNGDVRTG